MDRKDAAMLIIGALSLGIISGGGGWYIGSGLVPESVSSEPLVKQTRSAATASHPVKQPWLEAGARPFEELGIKAGQNYPETRTSLIRAGFIPVASASRACSPFKAECHGKPEIWNCSGTGEAFCEGYWLKGGDTVRVITEGGPSGVLASISYEATPSEEYDETGDDSPDQNEFAGEAEAF